MKKLLLILLVFIEFASFAQTTITVNRRRDATAGNPRTIPGNPFIIKEGNTQLFVVQYLKDHPLTIAFSSELTVQNGVPTPNQSTFDFGSITLTSAQESAALQTIRGFRDKDGFTDLENFNITAQAQIQEALEQIGDVFDEDSIGDLIVPDFCALRDQAVDFYTNSGWTSFDVGEKRILIADWGIPTTTEVLEIFQGGDKRREIFRLFGAKISSLKSLETIRIIEDLRFTTDGTDFTKAFNRIFSIGKADLSPELFISRSNSVSDNAADNEIDISLFSNVRSSSNFLNVLSSTEAEFTRNVTVNISYTCSVATSNNVNFQIRGERDRAGTLTPIEGQGMLIDGRGRGTLTHMPIKVSFQQGDKITFKLNKQNSSNGNLTVLSGRGKIRIQEEVK